MKDETLHPATLKIRLITSRAPVTLADVFDFAAKPVRWIITGIYLALAGFVAVGLFEAIVWVSRNF